MAKLKAQGTKPASGFPRWISQRKLRSRWFILAACLVGFALITGGWMVIRARAEVPKEAPEAAKVLALQAGMPFQILIPSYLPGAYDRQNMEINVNQSGPGGEPMVEMVYHPKTGAPLFIREWVPVNPQMEILAASRPVETKWGKGWLLKEGEDLIALWVDIGPLRASIYTVDQAILDKEHLLAIGETMGPASNRQVFSFVVDPPKVKEAQPPPPVEIQAGPDGVQAVDLIVTPGGYSPLRFSVKKGVKVRLTFRQLGQVGCGNELNFPIAPNNMAALKLESPTDKQVVEFTPQQTGQFEFYCGHLMYRGVMYVHE